MIQASRVSGKVHNVHFEAWKNYNKEHKFVPILKQRDADDETNAATLMESMPELKVPIFKMVNG